jgi:hypothetical protein
MIKKVEMHVSEHTLDEDDGPGSQSIDINLYVQVMGATPAEKAAIREIMNMAQSYVKDALKDLK